MKYLLQKKEKIMGLYEDRVGSLIRTTDAVVDANGGLRTNGEVSSLRTREATKQVMRETCRRLHRLGYKLESIDGLRARHIDAIVKSWHAQGLANKTMENQYSRIKIFCVWLGRPGIVDNGGKGFKAHLPGIPLADLKVSTVANVSKSWSGNGIDVIALLKRATLEDKRFGAMQTLGIGFGLRKKEMLRIKPWRADKGEYLEIDGSVAKNGKHRLIHLEKEGFPRNFQRWALDQAKALCKKNETLGWPELTFKQAENRFYHYCKRIGLTKAELGVTTHGSRAEFMENYLQLRGLLPPTLGGTADQMGKEERDEIILAASQQAGHDNWHTAAAYFGSFRRMSGSNAIGGRIGSILVNAANDTFGSVHCNPPVVLAKDGRYRHKSLVERSDTIVSISVESLGQRIQLVGLSEFMQGHGQLTEKVMNLLQSVGLGEQPPNRTDAG